MGGLNFTLLDEICGKIHNYFVQNIIVGDYTINTDGVNPLPKMVNNQYFRVVGSVGCDGVYQYPTHMPRGDESFHGSIQTMRVPPPFIEMVNDIDNWCSEYQNEYSPFISENLSGIGYSYTKATNADGTPITWETQFRKKLNRWRKI